MKIKVVFIGLGSRGTVYADIMKRMGDRVEFVAAADTNEEKRRLFCKKFAIPEEKCYRSWNELLNQPCMADVAVIATTDRFHTEPALKAMEKGYHLLLEKPISPVLSECLQIEETAEKYNRHVVVCHVLRYASFYSTIKSIIDSGEIGEVTAVEANESVCYWHQAHSFVRGNFRNSDLGSPMILAKCCHDMDILLWLTGKHCVSVSSIGSLKHFKASEAPEGAPGQCSEACPQYAACPYSTEKSYLRRAREEGFYDWPTSMVTPERTYEQLRKNLAEGPYGRCVYHCDNNVVDHQAVNLLLEDNVTVSFVMSGLTSESGRRIHVMGTKGDIVGNFQDSKLKVQRFAEEARIVDTANAETGGYAHGGGDFGVVKDLLSLFDEENIQKTALTSIHNSVESHVVALAAEASRVMNGQSVKIEEFIKNARKDGTAK